MIGSLLLCACVARGLDAQAGGANRQGDLGGEVAWDLDLGDAKVAESRPESSALARDLRVAFVWLREGELLLVKHGRDVHEITVATGVVRMWQEAPPRILGHLGGDVLVVGYQDRVEWFDYTRSKILGSSRVEIGGGAWQAWGSAQETRIVRPGPWLVRGYDLRGMGESVARVEDVADIAWLAYTGRAVVGGPERSQSPKTLGGPVSKVSGPASVFLGRSLGGVDAVFGAQRRLDRELLAIVNGADVTVWAQAARVSEPEPRRPVQETTWKGLADRGSKVAFVDEQRVAISRGARVRVRAIDGGGDRVAELRCDGPVMGMSAGGCGGRIVVAYCRDRRARVLRWDVGSR